MDPFILTQFDKLKPDEEGDPLVSVIIYEWRDEKLIGIYPSEQASTVRISIMFDGATADIRAISRNNGHVTVKPLMPNSAMIHNLASSS